MSRSRRMSWDPGHPLFCLLVDGSRAHAASQVSRTIMFMGPPESLRWFFHMSLSDKLR
jgi:hypothetical protein